MRPSQFLMHLTSQIVLLSELAYIIVLKMFFIHHQHVKYTFYNRKKKSHIYTMSILKIVVLAHHPIAQPSILLQYKM